MGMEHRIKDQAARKQDRSADHWLRETKVALTDGSVDMVLCHQVLHHMVQQRNALAEQSKRHD